MITKHHPIHLVIGEMEIQKDLADRKQQPTFTVIAKDCQRAANQVKVVSIEVLNELVTLLKRVELYAADGIFSTAERDQVMRDIEEMKSEIEEGRVI